MRASISLIPVQRDLCQVHSYSPPPNGGRCHEVTEGVLLCRADQVGRGRRSFQTPLCLRHLPPEGGEQKEGAASPFRRGRGASRGGISLQKRERGKQVRHFPSEGERGKQGRHFSSEGGGPSRCTISLALRGELTKVSASKCDVPHLSRHWSVAACSDSSST